MKRRICSLSIAAMLAGTALISALPASAQTYTNNFEATNNPGSATGGVYTITPQGSHPTYVKESGTAGANNNPVFLNEVSSGNSFGYTSGTNYTALVSTNSTLGLNGTGTFTNGPGYLPTTNMYQSTVQANDGSQALMVSWQQNSVTGGNAGVTSVYRVTTVGSGALSRPTVDLGGTVSFMMYFDTGAGTGTGTTPNTTPLTGQTMQVELGVNASSSSTTLGAYGNTSQTYSEYIVGSTNPAVSGTSGTTGTGSSGLVTGGKSITSGSWQKVTFNLKTDTQTFFAGTAATNGLSTNPYGFLYDMDFTASGVANQIYNVYIDGLTITPAAAPEPSEWAGMGMGALGLLGLAVRARRRGAGLTAA